MKEGKGKLDLVFFHHDCLVWQLLSLLLLQNKSIWIRSASNTLTLHCIDGYQPKNHLASDLILGNGCPTEHPLLDSPVRALVRGIAVAAAGWDARLPHYLQGTRPRGRALGGVQPHQQRQPDQDPWEGSWVSVPHEQMINLKS